MLLDSFWTFPEIYWPYRVSYPIEAIRSFLAKYFAPKDSLDCIEMVLVCFYFVGPNLGCVFF